MKLNFIIRYGILLLVAFLFFIFPIYWMITGSFKLPIEIWAIPPNWIPSTLNFDNFEQLFSRKPIFQWLFNSVFSSVIGVFFIVFFSAMAGYAYAKKRFPGSKILFFIVIATMLMPNQVTLIPVYQLVVKMGLINTYAGLILPAIAFPLGVFLIRQFVMTIPDELIEAAKMDGAGELRVFLSVIIPLITPALGALAIFAFMFIWNDYLWQLVILQSENMLTLPLGISTMIYDEISINYGMAMTGATIAAIPMIIFFLLLQKSFIKGITLGSVKG